MARLRAYDVGVRIWIGTQIVPIGSGVYLAASSGYRRGALLSLGGVGVKSPSYLPFCEGYYYHKEHIWEMCVLQIGVEQHITVVLCITKEMFCVMYRIFSNLIHTLFTVSEG